MGTLGVPQSYECRIVLSNPPVRTGFTPRTQDLNPAVWILAWSTLSWQRVMNEVSVAQVTVPRTFLEVGETHFFPQPWKHALAIYRNGYLVWSGPIISWSHSSEGDLTINARDGAVDMQKQFVGVSRNYVNEEVSQVIAQTFIDARLGERGYAPFPLTIGAFYPLGFYARSSAGDPGPSTDPRYIDAIVTLQLDYANFQRVYDVISDLAQQGKAYYCCVNDHLYVNEVGVRQQLAVGDQGWPILHDDNVIGLPSVDVDALDSITATVRLTDANERANGYPDHAITYIDGTQDVTYFGLQTFGVFDYVDGNYLYPPNANNIGNPPHDIRPIDYLGGVVLQSALPKGTVRSAALVNDSWGEREAFGLHGAPTTTVEQIQLAPSFSHPSLADDLNNLLPGVRFQIGFSDRSMFDHPYAERKLSVFPNSWRYDINGALAIPNSADTPWNDYGDASNKLADFTQTFDWGIKSLWISEIRHLRLIQLDVEVSSNNGAFEEVVRASMVPTIQYVLDSYAGTETLAVDYPVAGVINVPITARPRFVG